MKKNKNQKNLLEKEGTLSKSTLFFEKNDFKNLKIIAAKKETSVSAIVRQLIKNYLLKHNED